MISARDDLTGSLLPLPLCPPPLRSFKPDTGYTELYLAGSARSALVQESFMERVERLAYVDKQRKEADTQARSKHYYSQVRPGRAAGWRLSALALLHAWPAGPAPDHMPGLLVLPLTTCLACWSYP
jgi:hypothetical protein